MEAQTYRIEAQQGRTHWWFAARRRILKALLEAQGVRPEHRLYDLGCGTGQNLIVFQELAQAAGVDMSPIAREEALAGGCREVIAGDLTALPLPEACADVVVATDILEHLDDDAQGAREIVRVLKPGGLALITVPAFSWLWGTQDVVSHHKRRYTKAEVRTLLEGAGLGLTQLSYYNAFLFPPIFLGRQLIKLTGRQDVNENEVTPGFTNALLEGTFAAERHWLARGGGFPIGVSVLALGRKPGPSGAPWKAGPG